MTAPTLPARTSSEPDTADLAGRLAQIRGRVIGAEREASGWLEHVHPDRRTSAQNLLHYVGLRREDLRPIQPGLASLGLSSLGRAEPCVLRSVDAVRAALEAVRGGDAASVERDDAAITLAEGRALLESQSVALLGPRHEGRRVRVMVTMPTQAADAPEMVRDCVAAGMDVMRINAAHDGPDRWARMIEHLRAAEAELGRACRVQLDLAGPKIRTCPPADPDEALRVRAGDRLVLTGPEEPSRQAARGEAGEIIRPARVGCTAPEAIRALSEGDRVWFDDGKIGAVVRAISPDGAELDVVDVEPKGAKLRGDKGINLPDVIIPIETPTARDLEDLRFAAGHADMVAMSFVRQPADVHRLQEALRVLGAESLPIVLKIETACAFQRLPELLLTLMRSPVGGVMIARGDLAVELGWERLAEAQEEILWMCEAAHLPVVWATQVLESLAKRGRPTRSEVTDAAMSGRAECVMLNKGPFIVRTIRALDEILTRMDDHQDKKRPELRALGVARSFGHSGA